MKGVFRLKDVGEIIKSDKSVKIILAAGAALMLIIAFGGFFSSSTKTEEAGYSRAELAEYEAALEKRLSDILSEINGIGKTEVMITLDGAEQTEYGKSKDMLISVKAPQVRGVIVVCDGGDNIAVKEKVINAVSGVFGISTTRISVIK
ncbi:MAG: hypothetical protein ACI4J4_05070 [Ruminiclostridium sp.]